MYGVLGKSFWDQESVMIIENLIFPNSKNK